MLPPELSSEEEPDIDPLDTSGTLFGNSEPERAELPTSIVFTLSPLFLPEQPESMQTAAAIDTAPLILFFMIFSPIFEFYLYIRTLYL